MISYFAKLTSEYLLHYLNKIESVGFKDLNASSISAIWL